MGLITNLRGRTFGRLSISPRAEPEIRANRAWWPFNNLHAALVLYLTTSV